MLRKLGVLCGLPVLGLLVMSAVGAKGQGLDTQASKDDWEEINFEFNSSVLVDGFPSLLRLAELLQEHPDYHVRVEGYTDGIGSASYNDKLGLARANTVRDFLVKYGARAGQFDVVSRGKSSPKVRGEKPGYSKTDEARYMNRRVVLTVTDAQGKTVGAGGAGDAIRGIQAQPPSGGAAAANPNPDCCNEILKRLDKLDDIARMLKDLADQNAALKQEVATLKDNQQNLQNQITNAPKPPEPVPPPSADDIANKVQANLDKKAEPKFELLGVNVGPDGNGNATASGRARYFAPLNPNFALQVQGEYMYFRGQREAQLDLGMVDRIGRFQAGLFGSVKNVDLAGYQSNGNLGQVAFVADYIFGRGKVGIFGTQAFLDNAVINTVNATLPNGAILNHLFDQTYLSVVNQGGITGAIGLMGNIYAEGNFGFLRSTANGGRVGGTVRLVFPISNKIAFTVEGGLNETMIRNGNQGAVRFGVQFSNMLRPKEYLAANHAIPVDVPRVRYEIATRKLRNGDDPPIANAGPNQIGVPAGLITLDGSASYSPDGNPITYQWTQTSGTPVTLSSLTASKTTFIAASGMYYTFRLVVTDNFGAQSAASVSVSTAQAARTQIVFFISTPAQISSGQSSTLSWRVINSTSVNISPGIGNVDASGSIPVSPTQTTTYTITARNNVNQATASTAVVVGPGTAKLQYCYAQPAAITAGQTATLNWSAPNATSVNIVPGLGSEPATGTANVTPAQTTAYTITAIGANGQTQDSCGIVVTVGGPGGGTGNGGLPTVVTFGANPSTINLGQGSTLSWIVQNATTVSISGGIGTVGLSGGQPVTPTTTTTYTLTATNAQGSTTATAIVNVLNPTPTKVLSFTASPPTSPSPGSKVTLTCNTQGATTMTINGINFIPPTGVAVVFPQSTTTYMCNITGPGGQSDSASVTVQVSQPVTPTPPAGPTIVIAGGTTQQTINRDNYPDASGSFSPQGNNPLTFFWTSPNAAVLNPTSPKPQIQLPTADGDYVVYLTVTDSKGNSSTATIVYQYRGVNN